MSETQKEAGRDCGNARFKLCWYSVGPSLIEWGWKWSCQDIRYRTMSLVRYMNEEQDVYIFLWVVWQFGDGEEKYDGCDPVSLLALFHSFT